MKMSLLLCCLPMVLGGCDTSVMYERSTPQPPVRWPDDVKSCGVVKSVLVPMRILVTHDKYPFIPYGKNGAGCGYTKDDNLIVIVNSDSIGRGSAMLVDNSNRYRGYQVRYNFLLSRSDSFKSTMYYDPHWRTSIPASSDDPAYWLFNLPVGGKTSSIINGMKWTHYMFYGVQSASSDPKAPAIMASVASPGEHQLPPPVIKVDQPHALIWLGEVYAYRVDRDHKMLIWAQYGRAVTQDAHWLEVRRAMLRKLVDAVTITPLTPKRLEELRAEAENRLRGNKGK